MNTVRIGVIAIWLAVGASAYLSTRGTATHETPPARVTLEKSTAITGAPPTGFAATHRGQRRELDALAVHSPGKAGEPAFEPETPELTPPSQSPNQILDALNADIGPEGEYVDPEALAAALRSDPELGRLLNE
jgi:hypothetical protein